ncbi:hypothetical protein T492DRAFT_907944, partial [Pavlovales sp. CCMP2436]
MTVYNVVSSYIYCIYLYILQFTSILPKSDLKTYHISGVFIKTYIKFTNTFIVSIPPHSYIHTNHTNDIHANRLSCRLTDAAPRSGIR